MTPAQEALAEIARAETLAVYGHSRVTAAEQLALDIAAVDAANERRWPGLQLVRATAAERRTA